MNEQQDLNLIQSSDTECPPEEKETEALEENKTPEENGMPENTYAYRWNYDVQQAHDAKEKRAKGRRGVIVFACTMVTAFLLVLGLLLGVLAFRDGLLSRAKGMTTEQVAKTVLPATVLVYASNNTSYGYGTGFFVRSDGYIVTNYHVVSSATYIAVTLYPSEKSVAATVVGYSAADDIAVLKIAGSGYTVAKIGNSDAIRVGDTAIAVGNPAGISAPWSTTQGIISSTGRSVTVNGSASIGEMSMIQTDAPVNPGNSGGPLCNDRAEVIGIVTQKLSDYEALGFAIPINGAMKIVDAIIRTGSADGVRSEISRTRPTIGIVGSTIEKGEEFTKADTTYRSPANGVLVMSVSTGSGADSVLTPGDVIVAIDGTAVPSMDEMIEKLYTYKAGDTVTLKIYKLGESKTTDVKVTLGVAK